MKGFIEQHSSHPYYDKTAEISNIDRQVQIWSLLAKDWLRSKEFMSHKMEFIVRIDFTPTVYVDAANQAVFPIALTTTNNVKDLTERLQKSGDLF